MLTRRVAMKIIKTFSSAFFLAATAVFFLMLILNAVSYQ
jgi:hypothetical protein